jgi:hypothetical protein
VIVRDWQGMSGQINLVIYTITEFSPHCTRVVCQEIIDK